MIGASSCVSPFDQVAKVFAEHLRRLHGTFRVKHVRLSIKKISTD